MNKYLVVYGFTLKATEMYRTGSEIQQASQLTVGSIAQFLMDFKSKHPHTNGLHIINIISLNNF